MKWRAEISYSQLPQPLVEVVAENSLMWACANSAAGTVIVWTGTGERVEREFSLDESRFLTENERESVLPPARKILVSEQKIPVIQTALLLTGSNTRYERYGVYDSRQDRVIVECGQNFFSPVYQNPETVVLDALKDRKFPQQYHREWPRSERVSHWVMWLHQGRRWAGEDGRNEDEAFTPAAWRYMCGVDPDIEKLVPEILTELARLWMTDPEQLLKEFRGRVSDEAGEG